MIGSPYSAADWPIAAAMLPFGNKDSHGGAIHDAEPEEWAKHLRLVRRMGFTEVDPTDTWVRVGDLSPERLADFKSVLSDIGLTIPAISTSRRSVMDPEHGKEYLAYSHRLLDVAAELGVPLVSFGFFQELTAEQQRALWFWLAEGWHDAEAPEVRSQAASLIRELAEHAARNGQQITLEMYEDTYVGTCDGAVKFLKEVGHDACGLNPDIANFIRLHRPIEPVQDMLDKVLPYAKYWHVKNYLRDEDPTTGQVMTFPVPMEFGLINYRAAISQALELGFRGAFLCEHYGSVGMADDPLQRSCAAHRAADHRGDLGDAQRRERRDVGLDLVTHGHQRKSRAPRLSVRHAGELGPVDPRKPPSTLVAIAHQRSVSIGAPGPATPSHQPSVSSPGPVGPVTCESPVSACSTTTTLSRLGESSPHRCTAMRDVVDDRAVLQRQRADVDDADFPFGGQAAGCHVDSRSVIRTPPRCAGPSPLTH